MPYVELIAALAVMQFLIFGYMTGRARGRAGLKAPAMTGDESFERMYRVQMNTLECMVAFLPMLFMTAIYWPEIIATVLGLIYIIGRTIYAFAYLRNPASRQLGFILSMAPITILLILSLVGILMTLLGEPS